MSTEYKPLLRKALQDMIQGVGSKFTQEVAREVASRLCATLGESDPTAVSLFISHCPSIKIRTEFIAEVLRLTQKEISAVLQSGQREADRGTVRLIRTMACVCEATTTDLSKEVEVWLHPDTGFVNLESNLVTLIKRIATRNKKNGHLLEQCWKMPT